MFWESKINPKKIFNFSFFFIFVYVVALSYGPLLLYRSFLLKINKKKKNKIVAYFLKNGRKTSKKVMKDKQNK